MTQKGIKTVIVAELIILGTSLISYNVFLNTQLSFLSAFLIILGSMLSYKKMVTKKLQNEQVIQTKDEFDKLNDPYELYDEDETQDQKNLDIKTVVKEEKKRLKTDNYQNLKLSSGASFSLFRILPYLFLAVVFIILSHDQRLILKAFLPSLAIGIYCGYIFAKDIFIR